MGDDRNGPCITRITGAKHPIRPVTFRERELLHIRIGLGQGTNSASQFGDGDTE
jgi:hypothetical protein